MVTVMPLLLVFSVVVADDGDVDDGVDDVACVAVVGVGVAVCVAAVVGCADAVGVAVTVVVGGVVAACYDIYGDNVVYHDGGVDVVVG